MDELVERAKNNDEIAFDKLIMLMQRQMYLVAHTVLKNDDDIADAMQESILLCYNNIHNLRNNAFFRTWIIRILINECRKVYKKKEKVNISFEEYNINNYIISKNDYEDNVDFDMLIKNLKQEEKIILTLYYSFNYTTKEISKIIKKNENTVRTKMARAKEKLKKQYEGGYYEEF